MVRSAPPIHALPPSLLSQYLITQPTPTAQPGSTPAPQKPRPHSSTRVPELSRVRLEISRSSTTRDFPSFHACLLHVFALTFPSTRMTVNTAFRRPSGPSSH